MAVIGALWPFRVYTMTKKLSYIKFDELRVKDLDPVAVNYKEYVFKVYHRKSNELSCITRLSRIQDSCHFNY